MKFNINTIPTSKNKGIMSIYGDISISNIEFITNEIITQSKKYKKIDIELSNITNFDLTGIQLLYSIKKTYSKKIYILELKIINLIVLS